MITAHQYKIAKRWAESTKVQKELAEEFHITPSTVRHHLQDIYRHFGLYGYTAHLELAKIYANTQEHWVDWPTFLKWRTGKV